MKRLQWIAMFGLMAVLLVSFADEAMAQRRGGSSSPRPRNSGFQPFFELSATYGQMWGGNIDLSYSFQTRKIRAATGPSYSFALDYNMHPMQAIELSYTRQDGGLDLDYQGLRELTPMSVNIWHIGSLRDLTPPDSKVTPFIFGSLGATYFSPSNGTITLDDGTVVSTQSTTKFSLAFGLGLKAYFGEAQKVGIRASFKVIPTMYNTGAGLWFGTGGAGVTVGGNAIWQWEVAGGLTVKFGGS